MLDVVCVCLGGVFEDFLGGCIATQVIWTAQHNIKPEYFHIKQEQERRHRGGLLGQNRGWRNHRKHGDGV